MLNGVNRRQVESRRNVFLMPRREGGRPQVKNLVVDDKTAHLSLRCRAYARPWESHQPTLSLRGATQATGSLASQLCHSEEQRSCDVGVSRSEARLSGRELLRKREILTSQSATAPQNDRTHNVILSEAKNLVVEDVTTLSCRTSVRHLWKTRPPVCHSDAGRIPDRGSLTSQPCHSEEQRSCDVGVSPSGARLSDGELLREREILTSQSATAPQNDKTVETASHRFLACARNVRSDLLSVR